MQRNEPAMHHSGENSMMNIMHQMNDKMGAVKMHGDMDHDFAEMMIVHHQAAIDMAQQEINTGQNPMLKQLASKIIEDQTREIKQLQQWLNEQH